MNRFTLICDVKMDLIRMLLQRSTEVFKLRIQLKKTNIRKMIAGTRGDDEWLQSATFVRTYLNIAEIK
jgi:hypothetical protein